MQRRTSGRGLGAVLFTDIVGSTTVAIANAVRKLGIEIRAGVSFGQLEMVEGKPFRSARPGSEPTLDSRPCNGAPAGAASAPSCSPTSWLPRRSPLRWATPVWVSLDRAIKAGD